MLRELILAGLRDRWVEAFDPGVNTDLDDLVTNYVDRGEEIVIIEADCGIVASEILVPDEGTTARIMRISVATGHRRQGPALRIVEELIGRARRRVMSEVGILTDTPWVSAVKLYRKCGFTEIGKDETDTYFVMPL